MLKEQLEGDHFAKSASIEIDAHLLEIPIQFFGRTILVIEPTLLFQVHTDE